MRGFAGLFEEPAVERGMHFAQFGDRRLDAALLLLEQRDLRHALLARQVQRVAVRFANRRAVRIIFRRLRSLERYNRVAP
jgi:hypothetical protein